MRCPKCNFENRSDARFCKRCGQPLAATPAPPAQVAVCLACGVTAKPGARFCPRCGQPLPTTPQAQPQGYAQPPAQPPSPAQPYAQPPAPVQSQGYAQPPAAPPPPTAQPSQKRKLPRWALWAGTAAAVLLCIIATVVVGPKIFGDKKEPVASLTPVETPTVEATAIEAAPAETPTTEAPTATPLPDTPTPLPPPTPTDAPLPPPSLPLADVRITPLTSELRVGELLTITVTVTNTGETPFGRLRYQLLGPWEPSLRTVTPPVVWSPEMVGPGMSTITTFVLEAIQAGMTTSQVAITMETPGEPPRPGGVVSKSISVSVVQ